MSTAATCPECGIEVTEETSHCPRCNAVIDKRSAEINDDPPFPVLDENSGRVEPETLPPYSQATRRPAPKKAQDE